MGMFAAAARDLRGYRLTTFSPQSTAYWVAKLFGGGMSTAAGVTVNDQVAMSIATVYASCRNLAEDLAGLPLPVYRDNAITAGGSPSASKTAPRVIDRSAPAFKLLNLAPNPEMTAFTFKSTIHGHIALRGGAFAEKQYNGAGQVMALWPLNPAKVRMARNGLNGFTVDGAPAGRLFYIVALPSGEQKILDADLVFHPIGFSPDGINGYSIIAMAKEAIGLAVATEQFGGRFFSNDGAPGAVLSHPKTLSDKARQNIQTSWRETHEGLDNAHRIAILEEGLSVERVGIPPEDAQFLETRKFQQREIQIWFRMPPDKVGDFADMHYSTVEQSDIAYVRYTLGPRATAFEQQLAADGIVDADHYALHDLAAFLRADSKTRADYYHSLRQDGAISGEDIRVAEGWDPSGQDGADELLIPLNMSPVSAFQDNGLTKLQTAQASWLFLRGGWEADGVRGYLGLPDDMKHTGLVPGVTTPAPSEADGEDPANDPDAQADADAMSADKDSSSGDRSNGHHPELAIPAGRL